MTSSENAESARQNDAPPKRGRSKLVRRLIILLLFLAALGAGYLYARPRAEALYRKYFEEVPPKIEVSSVPGGVGASEVSFMVTLEDAQAGLDEVVIRAAQRGASREVFRKSLEGAKKVGLPIALDGHAFSFDEGEVILEIRAFDQSFFSNASELTVPLKVDFRRPRLETVTAQHNARRGGSQLVIYRATDQDLLRSGVRVGNRKFYGVPATVLDAGLKQPGLFAALFSFPLNTDAAAKAEELRLFAEDQVGNTVEAMFNHRLAGRNRRESLYRVDQQYIDRLSVSVSAPGKEPAELLKTWATEIKPVSFKKLSSACIEPFPPSLPPEPFARVAGIEQTNFGDTLKVTQGTEVVGLVPEDGIEFGVGQRTSIRPVSAGEVRLADELPGLGGTVVVVHAMGLCTVYSRLVSISAKPGSKVTKDSVLGQVGNSGVGRPATLHFQLLLQGTAIDPREFWDPQWFGPHITDKIQEAKRTLGLTFQVPSE